MEDVRQFYEDKLTEERTIRWPAGLDEQASLGRVMLGSAFVGTLDYWIDLATNYVTQPEPPQPFPRENRAAEHDRAYRSVFGQLTDEQRATVLKLVRQVASGVLFSTMVDIDQFPPADVQISLVERDDEDQITRRVEIYDGGGDLHDELWDWIARFSAHHETLMADL